MSPGPQLSWVSPGPQLSWVSPGPQLSWYHFTHNGHCCHSSRGGSLHFLLYTEHSVLSVDKHAAGKEVADLFFCFLAGNLDSVSSCLLGFMFLFLVTFFSFLLFHISICERLNVPRSLALLPTVSVRWGVAGVVSVDVAVGSGTLNTGTELSQQQCNNSNVATYNTK